MAQQTKIEKLFEYNSELTSPICVEDLIYFCTKQGDIIKYDIIDEELKTECRFGAELSSIAFEQDQNTLYIADQAHQNIYARNQEETVDQITEIIKDFDDIKLLGPNQVIYSEQLQSLIFTDSGPFGETTLDNPKGSILCIDLEDFNIKPIAYQSLAHPSGLALGNGGNEQEETILYVCETFANRIIRYVLSGDSGMLHSVLINFSGRFGPTNIVVSQSELIYVVRHEFEFLAEEGIISVVTPQGVLKHNIELPGALKISGLAFSKSEQNILYVTDNTNTYCCYKVTVSTEQSEEEKSKKDIKDKL